MASRIAFLAVFLAVLSFAVADGVVTLDSSPEFNNLRDCALNCYNGGIRDGYRVANTLGCRKPGVVYVPPDNDCFCRSDLQATAVRYLSNCAMTSCLQNDVDVSSATQVYKDYCSNAGYSAAVPNSVPAETTTDGAGTPTGSPNDDEEDNSTPTEKEPSDNTSTPDSNESSGGGGGSSGLGVGPIVGIAAGVISAIAAVIGCIIKYKQYKKSKLQAQQQQHQQQQGYQGYQGQEQHWK